jgi:ribonucleoside-diphosphate reductase alpha chain
VGGATMPMPSQSVRPSLATLGYSESEIQDIVEHLEGDGKGNIETAPHISKADLPIFDCAQPSKGGTRYIEPMGHVRMLAAIQPHLSGGISKTINMPHEATVEDMSIVGMNAWKMGIKDFTIYRTGSKRSEPLTVDDAADEMDDAMDPINPYGYREKMPRHRPAEIHRVKVNGVKFHWIFGHRDDERLGEIFVKVSKEGSTMQGALDGCCMALSVAIQHGASLKHLATLYQGTRWEPHGWTDDKRIKIASSPLDYLAQYLLLNYDDNGYYKGVPLLPETEADDPSEHTITIKNGVTDLTPERLEGAGLDITGDTCAKCGALTYRQGTCEVCPACGSTTGCGG